MSDAVPPAAGSATAPGAGAVFDQAVVDQSTVTELSDWAITQTRGDEIMLINIEGEATDFIRFNGADVRQAGSVHQASLSIQLIVGSRHTSATLQLSGDPAADRGRITRSLDLLREQLRLVPDDPWMSFSTEVTSSEEIATDEIPDVDHALSQIRAAGSGRDLVGIWTSGRMLRGFANSLGQRNWFESSTFNFDWTFYLHADKAAKNGYAGSTWDDAAFAAKVAASARQLDALARAPRTLEPGGYRSYLTPAALNEILGLLSWYGFSAQAHHTKQTPFLRMVEEGDRLSAATSLREATADGVGPSFQAQGFLRPEQVTLIEGGEYRDTLVSPRSAVEYGLTTNGASRWEAPESLALAPGAGPTATALERLGTGLWVGNLWYTNFSDVPACRVTGMTRFATFWVEDGEIVAPVNVLRFDDTMYNLLGDQLVELDDQAEIILDAGTYTQRSTGSASLPGALVDEMRFTL